MTYYREERRPPQMRKAFSNAIFSPQWDAKPWFIPMFTIISRRCIA